MAITTTLISGNDSEEVVYAVCYSNDLSLLFKFCRNPYFPTSMSSRIVACFNEIAVLDEAESFPNRESMRETINSLVARVWQACASHPSVRLPDVVVRIHEDVGVKLAWSISHESTFQEYLSSLMSVQAVQVTEAVSPERVPIRYIPQVSLQFMNVLGDRGGATIDRFHHGYNNEFFVYKGLSFRLYLELGTDFVNESNTFYHELALLHSLPSHPNIIAPPRILVTADSPYLRGPLSTDDQVFVCGFLQPYLQRQSLQELIEKSDEHTERLPLELEARWAFQVSSALAAVHPSHRFHMDLKPSNILLDDHENAVLIDWEQCGASPFFIAPEANGEWDAELVSCETHTDEEGPRNSTESTSTLVYRESKGSRTANDWTWPQRNIFLLWQKECPRALEVAEVYSLGRTLWVIFDQTSDDCFVTDKSDLNHRRITWNPRSVDIPGRWKECVSRCVRLDPNERWKFKDVVKFWERELNLLSVYTEVNMTAEPEHPPCHTLDLPDY